MRNIFSNEVQGDIPPELEAIFQPTAGVWVVLHTKSRQEKILADELARKGVHCYLPLIQQLRYYGQRKAFIDLPLFPGYVFIRGTLNDAYTADRTKRVANILEVYDQKRLDWELRNLSIALLRKARLDPYPFLKEGRPVRVRSGPFRGLEGLVEERVTWNRLILAVRMLGQGTSLEIDGSILEPMN